jgi:WD40 repeat protein
MSRLLEPHTLDGRPVAVTAGFDRTARVWDLATGRQLNVFTGHTDWVSAVACTAIGGRPVAVTASHDNTARIWDLATGEQLTTYTGHTNSVDSVACTTLDGRSVAATASYDNSAHIWDLATGDEVDAFDLRSIRAIAIGPDGELMVTTGWDIIVLDRVARH